MDRNTQQRDAIRDALEQAGRPLTPLEILAAAQARVPKLGLATVYRNIKSLVEEGWLRPVSLPGDAPRYELARIAHHHHFHCRVCNRVLDIQACPGELKHLVPRGYHVEAHEVVLYGRCSTCAKSGGKRIGQRNRHHAHGGRDPRHQHSDHRH